MEAVTVNPRDVAGALGIDVLDLADTMRGWAEAELRNAADGIGTDTVLFRYSADELLAAFEERVVRARRDLEGAIACKAAWDQDNPDEEEKD